MLGTGRNAFLRARAAALRAGARALHASAPAPAAPAVFDGGLLRAHRDRAAAAPDAARFDYLREATARALVARLAEDIGGARAFLNFSAALASLIARVTTSECLAVKDCTDQGAHRHT